MSRTESHIDGMLRHLGAAYYDSLQGRATQADVNRAVDNVAEHLNEQPRPVAPDAADAAGKAAHRRSGGHDAGFHGWSRRVSDVMATSVVTVDRATPYKEIARLLAEHRISGMPVLKLGREVVGVVTEADLLAAEDETNRRARMASSVGGRRLLRKQPPASLTAGTLMTAPAITIGPDATIPGAARLMNTHHIRGCR